MIISVAVTNPLSALFVQAAAQCDGVAAQKRDEAKTAAYAARGDSGSTVIPVSVETHGRLWASVLCPSSRRSATQPGRPACSRSPSSGSLLVCGSSRAVLNEYHGRMAGANLGASGVTVALLSRHPYAALSSKIGEGPCCVVANFFLWVVFSLEFG